MTNKLATTQKHALITPAVSAGPLAQVRQFAQPAYTAEKTLALCAGLPKYFRVSHANLKAARIWLARGIPTADNVKSAIVAIEDADNVQCDVQFSRLIAAILLDAFGRNANDNAGVMIEALTLVADADDDFDGDVLGIDPIHTSPLVVSLAVLRLIKTSKFVPNASELRSAMREIRIKLRDMLDRLNNAGDVIDAIEWTAYVYGDAPTAEDGFWDGCE